MNSVKKYKEDTVMHSKELEALVFLYEDPDPFVQGKVEERLIEIGEGSVPLLDEVQSKTSNKEIKERFRELIHSITFGSLEQEFINFLENGVNTLTDLEDGILLLTRFDNPTLRTDTYKKMLDQMASEIETEVRYAASPRKQMQILLNLIFEKKQFTGSSDEFFDPSNSFINKVLDRKKGIPISLALVVLFLANRLNLPFEGVNMPMHFLLKFDVEGEKIYIDPFNEGSVISVDQCLLFLKKSGIKPSASHFDAASNQEMLSRTIRNLINGYEKAKDGEKAGQLQRLLGFVDSMVRQ
ncbi:MAG: transglutaminase-like domain-containing protein [Balneolales bacterium]